MSVFYKSKTHTSFSLLRLIRPKCCPFSLKMAFTEKLTPQRHQCGQWVIMQFKLLALVVKLWMGGRRRH